MAVAETAAETVAETVAVAKEGGTADVVLTRPFLSSFRFPIFSFRFPPVLGSESTESENDVVPPYLPPSSLPSSLPPSPAPFVLTLL